MPRLPFPIFLAGLGLIAGLVLAPASPSQAGGLTVTGGKIDVTVKAGESYKYSMQVRNTTQEPMDVLVECQGYGTTGDNICLNLTPSFDTGLCSARNFLTVEPSSMHLKPGDYQNISITAVIPPEVSGGRYAVVNISTLPQGENVSTVSALSARVLFTIADTHLDHQSRISGVAQTRPGHVCVTITHEGNHHFQPRLRGQLIKDGQILAEGRLDDDWPLIPGYDRNFDLGFAGSNWVPEGDYEVSISVQDDSGNAITRHSLTLKMDAFNASDIPTVTPPIGSTSEFLPVSIVLHPAEKGLLATENHSIEIIFPAGSVISRAELTLTDQPVVSLPPQGLESSGISFHISGLNGLLAKNAVLKVRYTADVIKKAGGDAKRLVLARWNENLNQWTLIETSSDPETLTLTAETNQLGTLAVFILPTQTINRPLIIGIFSVIVLAAFAAALAFRRKLLTH